MDNVGRLKKVGNVLTKIISNFQKTPIPRKAIVIDKDHGTVERSTCVQQYLPAKSHKYGYKICRPCTSDGFSYKLSVYYGKNDLKTHGTYNRNMHSKSYIQ